MDTQKNLIEAGKEFLRIMLSGIIVATAAGLTMIVTGINTATGEILVQWNVVGATYLAMITSAAAIGLPKAFDKFIYKTQEDASKNGVEGWKGLTGF